MISAWAGDWHERVKERVRERGFDTVTEFADSQPRASLLALADELGQDVAASQIENVLIGEAEATDSMNRCARSLLVRRLNEKLPEGWHTQWNHESRLRRASAFGLWCAHLPRHYDPCLDRVEDALLAAPIPEGWLPAGPDDPILVELFRQHWHESASQQASDARHTHHE